MCDGKSRNTSDGGSREVHVDNCAGAFRGPLPTLGWVLRSEVIQRGRPQLLAGHDRLDSLVRWVHISEQPDIAGFLHGREVLLTTASALRDDVAAQRSYVRSLSAASLTALVVHPAEGMTGVPDGIVAEAATLGLPLVELRHPVPFVEITEQVHESLLGAQVAALRQAENLRRELTGLVVAGAGLAALTTRLSEGLGRPVVLEDAWGHVVSSAWAGHQHDEVLELWSARHPHRPSRIDRASRVQSIPGCCSQITITVRGAEWGRLTILADARPAGAAGDPAPIDPDQSVVAQAAAALTLAVLTETDARSAVDQARDLVLEEISQGTVTGTGNILLRARSLGADFSGGKISAFVMRCTGLSEFASAQRLTEVDRQLAVESLRSRVQSLVRGWVRASMTGVRDDRLVCVLERPRGEPVEPRLVEATDELRKDIRKRWDRSLDVVVGLSRPAFLSDARQALAEAEEAARYGSRSGAASGLYRYADLGLHHLLHRLARQGRLAAFVEAELAQLLEYERSGRSNLLVTLESYLVHNSQATLTAQALFIERRTLYHRLHLIEALLGRTLDDHSTRTRLGVALRGLPLVTGYS